MFGAFAVLSGDTLKVLENNYIYKHMATKKKAVVKKAAPKKVSAKRA